MYNIIIRQRDRLREKLQVQKEQYRIIQRKK